VTVHTEDSLGGPGIAQVLDLPFAVAATETLGAESLVTCENRQIFNLITARITAVGTTAADE
jgi:hypothetical protein